MKRSPNSSLIILIVAITIAAVIAGGYYFYTISPEYCIHQVEKSIREKDKALFQRYTASDGIAESIVDGVITKPARAVLGNGIFGKLLVVGALGLFKDKIVSSVEADILRFVETGSFEGKAHNKQTEKNTELDEESGFSGFTLQQLDNRLGFTDLRFTNIDSKKLVDDAGTVKLRFERNKTAKQSDSQSIILVLQMRKVEGRWKIISLVGFDKFLLELLNLKKDEIIDDSDTRDERPPESIDSI